VKEDGFSGRTPQKSNNRTNLCGKFSELLYIRQRKHVAPGRKFFLHKFGRQLYYHCVGGGGKTLTLAAMMEEFRPHP
jgi:hypothetical protein